MVRKFVITLSLFFLLFSCGNNFNGLKEELSSIKTNIQGVFDELKQKNDAIGKQLEDLLKAGGLSDLNIDDMLEKDSKSPKYKLFNGALYKAVDDGGAVVYASAVRPIDDETLRLIKLYEKIEPKIVSVVKDSKYVTSAWAYHQYTIGFGYPYFDVISVYPPNLDMNLMTFYQRMEKDKNPSMTPQWTPVDEPYVGMSGEGWLLTRGYPVFVTKTDDKMTALVDIDTQLSIINKEFIEKSDSMVIVVSSTFSLIASSQEAKNTFGLKVLEDVDYLEQMKNNSFIQDQFNLENEAQNPDIRQIPTKIKESTKDDGFEIEISGKAYQVFYEKTDDPAFYIIGFGKK